MEAAQTASPEVSPRNRHKKVLVIFPCGCWGLFIVFLHFNVSSLLLLGRDVSQGMQEARAGPGKAVWEGAGITPLTALGRPYSNWKLEPRLQPVKQACTKDSFGARSSWLEASFTPVRGAFQAPGWLSGSRPSHGATQLISTTK